MNKFALETAKSYGFLTIIDNNAADAQPELNKQKRLGIDNNFELSYETEKLQLSLFDRLEWNRYRYNDTSYNTSPLFNSVGVSANLKIASFEFFVQLSDDYRSGYATSAMNGHKLMSMASVSYSFCKTNAVCACLPTTSSTRTSGTEAITPLTNARNTPQTIFTTI